MSSFIHPLDHAETRSDKPFKTTFHLSEHLLVGMNVLLPGQAQPIHDHAHADKFYHVLAGMGEFTVGADTQSCGPGDLILAPAGIPHGVHNPGPATLIFLTAIAPYEK